MTINVEETVKKTLNSFTDWKPFGWHRNSKGQFELKKKNIKQIIHFKYQGVEFLYKNFVLKVGKGLVGDDAKLPPYYKIEVRSTDNTKLLYYKSKQDTTLTELGNFDAIYPLLKRISSPHFYLVQESDRKMNYSALALAQKSNIK